MKIVFMGTPDYAVSTLRKLIDEGHDVAAVFSQPDKKVGRKQILTPPPVKECALKNGIPVFQPETLKDGKAEAILREIAPEVIVVVAYGKILPKEILNIAKFGCVNGHASLLPKYRGASPIQWCIVCGEEETGVTTMLMDEGMDTGDILEQAAIKIGENETAEELFERLSVLSAELMAQTLKGLEEGSIIPKKQPEGATYAPIIKKDMALLDFTKSAKEVHNAIRGYYSWPCAYFFLNGKRIKVISASVGDETNKKSGTVLADKNNLSIACKDRFINLSVIQPEGSKVMEAKQFLCGNSNLDGIVIGEENG